MSHLPGTTRSCDAPGCREVYDAVTGPLGQTAEWCWRRHRTFGLNLCPKHSGLWGAGGGPHVPRLNRPGPGASCSCGDPLSGVTLGEMADAYRAHIAPLANLLS